MEYDYTVRRKRQNLFFFCGHTTFCSVSSWPYFPTFTWHPISLWNPKYIAWNLFVSSCRQTTIVNSKFAYGVFCACLWNWSHCITVRVCNFFPGIPGINVFLHFSMFHKLYILRLTDISLVISQLQGILCTQILTVQRTQKRKNPTWYIRKWIYIFPQNKVRQHIKTQQVHEEDRNEN